MMVYVANATSIDLLQLGVVLDSYCSTCMCLLLDGIGNVH